MKPKNYSEEKVHEFYDDALNRRQSFSGVRVGIGSLIQLARKNGYPVNPATPDITAAQPANTTSIGFDLDSGRPVFHPAGMAPRTFVGPKVGNAKLFPLGAMSLVTALGSGGKTSLLIALSAHIAAGKAWGNDPLEARRVVVYCVEERQDELNRKYGASVNSWTDAERGAAEDNLRFFSCLDGDPRLTVVRGSRDIVSSGLADQMIHTAKEFGAELIVIDHLQGFVSGDLNNSDTATALAREVNRIVAATGAAVVVTAHIAKTNIGAQSVTHGFTTGSLAFENAARQVVGIIPLPDADAKKLGMEAVVRDFMKMEMPKNSYGPAGAAGYLHKQYVPAFYTVRVEPCELSAPSSTSFRSREERLREEVAKVIRDRPGMTKSKFDELAGKKAELRASRSEVRKALEQLVADSVVVVRKPTQDERRALRIPYQVKEIYALADESPAILPAKPLIAEQGEARAAGKKMEENQ